MLGTYKSFLVIISIITNRAISLHIFKFVFKQNSTEVMWDKLPKCIFENFEIFQVKQGQFQNFQKSRG